MFEKFESFCRIFPNPLLQNNCHPKGICLALGPNAYRCECSAGQRDLNPADPGRKCVPTQGYNECEREEDNECSENARCVDLVLISDQSFDQSINQYLPFG